MNKIYKALDKMTFYNAVGEYYYAKIYHTDKEHFTFNKDKNKVKVLPPQLVAHVRNYFNKDISQRQIMIALYEYLDKYKNRIL